HATNDTYTPSLHDALPIYHPDVAALAETESTLIAAPAEDEEQQYSRDEAEDVSEIGDVLRRPVPRKAQLSEAVDRLDDDEETDQDRKSTRLNSSHGSISYA